VAVNIHDMQVDITAFVSLLPESITYQANL